MAGDLNRATLIGRLGRDPEVRHTQDGRPIVNMSIATGESWKDKNTGERREKVEWHRVVIFSEGLCGVAEKYLSKGDKVLIEGTIRTRKWEDKDGVEKYSTEIVLQGFDAKLLMLSTKGNGGADRDDDERIDAQTGEVTGGRKPASKRQAATGKKAPAHDDMDDEIPF